MSWESHRASVIAAQRRLTLLRALISQALDEQDVALAAVAVAVGSEPGTESGRDAFLRTANIATRLQEALTETVSANEALSVYGSHF
jgi:hypothetical protein